MYSDGGPVNVVLVLANMAALYQGLMYNSLSEGNTMVV